MRCKTVSVSYTRKINLGDYNSAEASCTIWAELDYALNEDIGEGMDAAMRDLWTAAKNNVKAQVVPLTNKSDQTAAEMKLLFLGVPVVSPEPKSEQESE